jgi:general secretion pathway protein C
MIALYLAGASFFIAHTINAVIAEALLPPPGAAYLTPAALSDPLIGRSPSAIADQVLQTNLFPSPLTATGIGGEAVSSSVPRQPLNLNAKLRLLGVVMSNRGGLSAVVELLSSKQQLFLRVHDQIPDIGELSEVRHDGIVVRQGEQEELLALMAGPEAQPPVQTAAAGTQTGPVPGAPLRKTVDRREVEQALDNLPKLLSQARAVPVVNNGAMSGFRMDYIAPGSFYEKIGLKYGDVLKQVNGVEIKDPGTMLSLFQQLRNERTVKLDILRNNQRTTMAYEIR